VWLYLGVCGGMILLLILYRISQASPGRARCPHFGGARHFARGRQDQCRASTSPVTDPRMTSGFDPDVCESPHYKSCPTYRAAKSGRQAS
jgi:hypothetical protein